MKDDNANDKTYVKTIKPIYLKALAQKGILNNKNYINVQITRIIS